jgi:iron only hydrogenase large subunit-like protein
VIAQVSPKAAAALGSRFGLSSLTTGKIIAAVKLLGFERVFDSTAAIKASDAQLSAELQQRIKDNGRLPMISGRPSESVSLFVKNFYPDLTAHLAAGKSPQRIFTDVIKSSYAAANGLNAADVTTVSFVPGIAQKYGTGGSDFTLTAGELAGMIKLAGIDVSALPEESFDAAELPAQGSGATGITDKKTVCGFAQARETMEAIRRGECSAKWLEIES